MGDDQLVRRISSRLSLDSKAHIRADVSDLVAWASNGRVHARPPRVRFPHSWDACPRAYTRLALDRGCNCHCLKTLPATHSISGRNYCRDNFDSRAELHSVYMVARICGEDSRFKD